MCCVEDQDIRISRTDCGARRQPKGHNFINGIQRIVKLSIYASALEFHFQ